MSQQDVTEAGICELMRILYSNPDLLRCRSAISSLNHGIAVLRLGLRISRLSVARALHQLFDGDDIRDSESLHAFQPLIDMLNATSEN